MGKVKSAIITAFVVAVIIVLAIFSTVSFTTADGVSRYNSFVSSIRLGSDLAGDAYVMLYPEGVLSAEDYNNFVEDENPARDEYMDGYTDHNHKGTIYVKNDKYGPEFAESVRKDAEILSKRFGERGYSSYSVTVQDDFSIKVTVPTNFTYAAYITDETKQDSATRSAALSEIGTTVQYLMLDGKISLRSSEKYTNKNSLFPLKDFGTFFSDISYYSFAGNKAVRMTLTDDGFKALNDAIAANSGTAYLFVGKTNLNLTINLGSGNELTDKTVMFQPSNSLDYAILLSSVISGDTLSNVYNDYNGQYDTSVVAATSAFGEKAAVYLFAAVLVIIAATVVASAIKYKKLGLVNAIVTLLYSLAMVTALMLTGIQLTIAGAFVAVLGLALLNFSNFKVFENVRAETKLGRTIQAAVKTGYKKSIATILDLHIILVIAAALFALIGVGEVASCGLIFFMSVIASYVMHWFTRFMWYVNMSPARDKFKFCGYTREMIDDED